MCVPLAPVLNPAGFALSKLPGPSWVADPASAVQQAVVGKNALTDPTYKMKSSAPAAAPKTALAQDASLDGPTNPFLQGTNTLKTALGS